MRFHPLLVLLAFIATHGAASPRVALMIETFATPYNASAPAADWHAALTAVLATHDVP